MGGNGGMTTEEAGEQWAGYRMPYQAPGTVDAETRGGHLQIRNQDEDDMTAAIVEATPYVAVEGTWNSVEDDSHVQGIYREADWAGS